MRNKDYKFPQAQFANNSALAATCRIKTNSLAFLRAAFHPYSVVRRYKHSTVLALGPTPPSSLPLAPFLSTVARRQQQNPLCGPGVGTAAGKETLFRFSLSPSPNSVGQLNSAATDGGRGKGGNGEEQRQEHLCKRQQEFDTSNICQ